MQLTKKDVLQIVGMIQVNYAYAYKDMTKESISLMADMWFNSLKGYPKDVIAKVFQYTIEKSTRPPTLADIIGNLRNCVCASFPNENQLWNEILHAISCAHDFYRFGDQYTIGGKSPDQRMQCVFDNLNEISRKWLNDIETIKNMRKLDMTAIACEKARFSKELPNVIETVWLHKRCSPHFLSEAVNNNLLLKSQDNSSHLIEDTKHTQ